MMTFVRALTRLCRTCALPSALVLAALPSSAHAQMIDDGITMTKGSLFIGNVYSHDSWKRYWEGSLERDNGNIGTLTTRTNVWFANYGISDRLNVIGTVPHVWTRASQGVLQGMEGFQDLTLGAKYRLVDASPRGGSLRGMVAVSTGLPMTDYTPDFYPLSIGSHSKRVSGRFTLTAQASPGWYATGSTAYTWRAGVTLDRPYYYTSGQLFTTPEVDMPNVFDYLASAGFQRGALHAAFQFSQQVTLGGDDIRRQDMPFVSNKMNFTRVGGMVMTPIPKARRLVVQFAYAYTVDGRNVGQARTWTTGLFYRVGFNGGTAQ